MDPTRQPPAPDVAAAARGGVVTVTTASALGSVDPSATYDTAVSALLTGLVTRSLTQWVWDPATGGMVLIPDLATDLGRANADYTAWTFTIRDGVRFEDGTPVTAADVAYGIKRSMDRASFPYGPTWGNLYFLHGDTYQGLYDGGSDYDGVVADGQTLTIKMARPFPDMPYYGAFPEMGPIPQAGSDPATYGQHPLATGPYKIKELVPDKSLTLVRNDQWDPATDPGRHQYADEFDFLLSQHQGAEMRGLLADKGRSQTSVTLDDVTPAVWAEARAAADRLVTGPTNCDGFVWPDYRSIDDVRVRRALGYGFPYRQFDKATGSVPGVTNFAASSILPPSTPGRMDYDPLSTQPWVTDAGKARELLRQANYQPGEYRIDFAYPGDDPTAVAWQAVLVKYLTRAGFEVVAHRVADGDAFFRIQSDPNAPLNLRFSAFCADWPSGTSWIPVLFATGRAPPSAFGWFGEPTVDREMARIQTLPLDQQDAAWGALDRTIEQKYYPVIINAQSGEAELHGSRLGGLHPDSVYGMPTFKDMYVIPR